jgi:hypothetical protein
MKYSIILLIYIIFYRPCLSQNNPYNSDYLKGIKIATENNRSIHLILNVKFKKVGTYMLLLTNNRMYIEMYKKNLSYGVFTDSIASILMNPNTPEFDSLDNFKPYIVDTQILKNIEKKLSSFQVYKKYFNKFGNPKYKKYSIEEIKAAVAFLIQNNVFVHEGEYYTYNVYVPPAR